MSDLDGADLVRLRTPRTLRGLELDALSLVQRPVAGRLDRAVVHEDIRAAAIDLNEAEALLTVEPLDGSLCHELYHLTLRPHLAVLRPLSDARPCQTPTQDPNGVELTTAQELQQHAQYLTNSRRSKNPGTTGWQT